MIGVNKFVDDDLDIGKQRFMRVTVCIASIGRPSLLTTLHSIVNCRAPLGSIIDVVIADDSENGDVGVLLGKENNWPLSVQVISTAARNISVARNACLTAAAGDYLAFIDDDMWADPDWLINFISQAEGSGADAIFGPILAVYPPDAPKWIQRASPFGNQLGAHGSQVITGATGNAFVRRECIERLSLRFREDFGRTGGEDTDFFSRLYAAGGMLIVSDSAKLFEPVSLERLRVSHLCRRYIRGGQTYANVIVTPAPYSVRIQTYLMALVKIIAFMPLIIITYPVRKDLALKCALKVWLNMGKLRHACGLPLFKMY